MIDKQSIIKPTILITGFHTSEEELALLLKIEDYINENPFIRMYYMPSLYAPMVSSRDPNANRRNYMDQRLGEIQQSDFVIIHEQLINKESAFDLGYAYALNKPILLITEHGVAKHDFEVLHNARINTIDDLSDYNFLKANKGHR